MYLDINISLCFTGRRQVYPSKKKGGAPREVYLGMTCKNVKKLGGYRLSQDDPSMFTDKPEFLVMDREFPNEEYPAGADADTQEVPQPGPSKEGEPSTSTAELKQAREQTKSMLVKMHTELVKMATKGGIKNLCALDKEDRAENVISGITNKDLRCKFCNKVLSTVTHLKNHIRSLHLHKTAHHCAQCNRFFSEASTLNRHMVKHDQSAKKFVCGQCQKEFPTQYKLDDHSTVHTTGSMYRCQYCKEKTYRRLRAVRYHEETCASNPNKLGRVKCRLCPKDFKERRLMKKHFKSAHPGEDPEL